MRGAMGSHQRRAKGFLSRQDIANIMQIIQEESDEDENVARVQLPQPGARGREANVVIAGVIIGDNTERGEGVQGQRGPYDAMPDLDFYGEMNELIRFPADMRVEHVEVQASPSNPGPSRPNIVNERGNEQPAAVGDNGGGQVINGVRIKNEFDPRPRRQRPYVCGQVAELEDRYQLDDSDDIEIVYERLLHHPPEDRPLVEVVDIDVEERPPEDAPQVRVKVEVDAPPPVDVAPQVVPQMDNDVKVFGPNGVNIQPPFVPLVAPPRVEVEAMNQNLPPPQPDFVPLPQPDVVPPPQVQLRILELETQQVTQNDIKWVEQDMSQVFKPGTKYFVPCKKLSVASLTSGDEQVLVRVELAPNDNSNTGGKQIIAIQNEAGETVAGVLPSSLENHFRISFPATNEPAWPPAAENNRPVTIYGPPVPRSPMRFGQRPQLRLPVNPQMSPPLHQYSAVSSTQNFNDSRGHMQYPRGMAPQGAPCDGQICTNRNCQERNIGLPPQGQRYMAPPPGNFSSGFGTMSNTGGRQQYDNVPPHHMENGYHYPPNGGGRPYGGNPPNWNPQYSGQRFNGMRSFPSLVQPPQPPPMQEMPSVPGFNSDMRRLGAPDFIMGSHPPGLHPRPEMQRPPRNNMQMTSSESGAPGDFQGRMQPMGRNLEDPNPATLAVPAVELNFITPEQLEARANAIGDGAMRELNSFSALIQTGNEFQRNLPQESVGGHMQQEQGQVQLPWAPGLQEEGGQPRKKKRGAPKRNQNASRRRVSAEVAPIPGPANPPEPNFVQLGQVNFEVSFNEGQPQGGIPSCEVIITEGQGTVQFNNN